MVSRNLERANENDGFKMTALEYYITIIFLFLLLLLLLNTLFSERKEDNMPVMPQRNCQVGSSSAKRPQAKRPRTSKNRNKPTKKRVSVNTYSVSYFECIYFCLIHE